MKWFMNDDLLMVVTSENQVVIFDSLLYCYSLSKEGRLLSVSLGTPLDHMEHQIKRPTFLIRGQGTPLVLLRSIQSHLKLLTFPTPVSAVSITKVHLALERVNHVCQLLAKAVREPETWLACLLQLVTYCQRYP